MSLEKWRHNCLSIVCSLFAIITIWAVLPSYATATTDSSESSGAGFDYSVQFPENQINADVGYFDLLMQPGQSQTASIILTNPGAEAITVEFTLTGAKTNRNGVIEYSNTEIENDASLQFPFESIVTSPGLVDLAAGETKEVQIPIQMPETSYDGIIVGGITMLRTGQTENVAGSGSSQVINQYRYMVAMVLRENDTAVLPELNFNAAYAEQVNARNSIFVNFSNVMATYVSGLTVEAQVMRQGSSEVLYETRSTALRMAPNSFMEFPISMNGDRMVAGMYTTHVLAMANNQQWEWTEDFEITEEEAQRFNERDVALSQETGIDWALIAMIVGGIVIVAVVIFIFSLVLRKKGKRKKKGQKRK